MADAVPDIAQELAASCGARRPMLIAGSAYAGKQGKALGLSGPFGDRIVFGVSSNPTPSSIELVLTAARHWRADMIVAVGGGSTLDTAKVVAAFAQETCSVAQGLTSGVRNTAALPLVAVPTTAGTGSEVTSTATVWDDVTGTKHSLSGPDLFPLVAVIDPDFIATVPPLHLASTCLDALSHALEGAWSVNSTDESTMLGIESAAILCRDLLPLTVDPRDTHLRQSVMRAALMAGLSISQGQTTLAHAISYPLTLFWGIPHGYAASLSLGALLVFNSAVGDDDCNDQRGPARVRSVCTRLIRAIGTESAADACLRIDTMIRSLGLASFRARSFDCDRVATEVMRYDRFRNNPRRMSRQQLNAFLVGLN